MLSRALTIGNSTGPLGYQPLDFSEISEEDMSDEEDGGMSPSDGLKSMQNMKPRLLRHCERRAILEKSFSVPVDKKYQDEFESSVSPTPSIDKNEEINSH